MVNYRSLPPYSIRLSVFCLISVIGLAFLGSHITTQLMANHIGFHDAEKISKLVRHSFREEESESIWENPLSPEAAAVFVRIHRDSILHKIADIRDFKIWDGTGNPIWPRKQPETSPGPEFSDRPSPFTWARFKNHPKYGSATFLETRVPIRRKGASENDPPDLVVSIYTRPHFVFDHLFNGRNFFWPYTIIIAIVVYLFMVGSLLWASRHRQIAEKQAARLEIGNSLAKAVGSTLKPNELFAVITKELRKIFPFERAVISTIDVPSNRYVYWHTESEVEMRARAETIGPNEWKGEGVYDLKRPRHIPDLSKTRWKHHDRIRQAGMRSLLIFPIIQNEQCIAHCSLSSTMADAFSGWDDEELLASISTHLGMAIRNATLYQAAEERSVRLAILNELSLQIAQNLALEEILESIARSSMKLTRGVKSHILYTTHRGIRSP